MRSFYFLRNMYGVAHEKLLFFEKHVWCSSCEASIFRETCMVQLMRSIYFSRNMYGVAHEKHLFFEKHVWCSSCQSSQFIICLLTKTFDMGIKIKFVISFDTKQFFTGVAFYQILTNSNLYWFKGANNQMAFICISFLSFICIA